VTWYGHMSEISVKKGDFVQPASVSASPQHRLFDRHPSAPDSANYRARPEKLCSRRCVDPAPFLNSGEPATGNQFCGGCDRSGWHHLAARQAFKKTWRIRNTATRPGRWLHAGIQCGETLGAPESVPLPVLAPGQVAKCRSPVALPLRRHRGTGWAVTSRKTLSLRLDSEHPCRRAAAARRRGLCAM